MVLSKTELAEQYSEPIEAKLGRILGTTIENLANPPPPPRASSGTRF